MSVAKKYHDNHATTSASSTSVEAAKKTAVEDKRAVEQYKNLISLKIKDPEFAKKAALIIENMLNPFPHKK